MNRVTQYALDVLEGREIAGSMLVSLPKALR